MGLMGKGQRSVQISTLSKNGGKRKNTIKKKKQDSCLSAENKLAQVSVMERKRPQEKGM